MLMSLHCAPRIVYRPNNITTCSPSRVTSAPQPAAASAQRPPASPHTTWRGQPLALEADLSLWRWRLTGECAQALLEGRAWPEPSLANCSRRAASVWVCHATTTPLQRHVGVAPAASFSLPNQLLEVSSISMPFGKKGRIWNCTNGQRWHQGFSTAGWRLVVCPWYSFTTRHNITCVPP